MHDPMDDPELRRAVEALREPVRVDAAFDRRVMAAVHVEARRRAWWSRATGPLRLTPMAGAAIAASLIAVAGIGVAAGRAGRATDASSRATPIIAPIATPTSVDDRVAAAPSRGHHVQFVLVAPRAKRVAVLGDFNDWDAARGLVAENRGGVWSVTARVEAGHHRYAFVVDDTSWVADPAAPRVVDEDFGRPTSAILVGETLQ